jgi:AsmA protein
MQETEDRRELDDSGAGLEIDPEDLQPKAWVPPGRKKVLLAAAIVVAVLSMVLLPPFISANRYRRQIASSISASLGRPVHMDSVSLNVLPLPGFTLTKFVVDEDPAFGSEPVIRAETVRVVLRFSSLWRRRVEFSRITLDDPSVNLVHRADGRWNIEGILLQASKIEAAPTAQAGAGPAPRFPYIEATGARVNMKMGLEKLPLALTEADFSLWLPQPQQWRLRLEGKPARTDAAATDTGTIRIEGTLGGAARADALQDVPIDLTGEWRAAALGGVSQVLTGSDAGLRGEMTLRTSFQGTVGENAFTSRLELTDMRRAEFVPERTLDATVACKGRAQALFHSLSYFDCHWPMGEEANGPPFNLEANGSVPDLMHPRSAAFSIDGYLQASRLLDVLRAMSARVSPELKVEGAIAGSGSCCPPASERLYSKGLRLGLGNRKPFVDGAFSGEVVTGEFTMAPLALNLGGAQPAMLTANVDEHGYAMHLTGTVLRARLLALAGALPQFGDGLEDALPDETEGPLKVDLVSNRTWAGGQTWSAAAVKVTRGKKRR